MPLPTIREQADFLTQQMENRPIHEPVTTFELSQLLAIVVRLLTVVEAHGAPPTAR